MLTDKVIMIPASHAITLKNALGSAIERWTSAASDARDMGLTDLCAQLHNQVDSAWEMIRAADEVAA